MDLKETIWRVVTEISRGNDFGYIIVGVRPSEKSPEKEVDWTIAIVARERSQEYLNTKLGEFLTKISKQVVTQMEEKIKEVGR